MIKIFLFILVFFESLYGGWAEETLKTLTPEEKIGQLFVVPACPRFDSKSLEKILATYHIGGVIVKQGHPKEQILFLNGLQEKASLPLLCSGDAEWGLGMRMEETLSFPKNEILGALEDRKLLYQVGKIIGEQCRTVGIHLNFAPVVDVNSNPDNTVIGARSFGADPHVVAECAVLMIQGMSDGGVLTCAKHFPGHGDTIVDSHVGLPLVPHTRKRLEEVELVPFKAAVKGGVDAVMTAHILVPAFDPKMPASLSAPTLEALDFEGLMITDALNMKALTKNYTAEEIVVGALLAGHDLLLYGAHRYEDVEVILTKLIPVAYAALKKAYQQGIITDEILDYHVLKILRTKERLGLNKNRLTKMPGDLMQKLHSREAVALIDYLSSSSSRTSTSASSISGLASP